LPFAYALQHESTLNNLVGNLLPSYFDMYDTCVFLPKCAYEVSSAKRLISQVCDANDLRSRSLFVIFNDDLQNSKLLEILSFYNIDYISGSSSTYHYDLIRTVQLLKQFTYMVTNSLGSHIAYAASMGLKIMLSSEKRHRSVDEFATQKWSILFDKPSIDRFVFYNTYEYFMDKFFGLFTLDKFSDDLTLWGHYQIGTSRMLPFNQIQYLLGWNRAGLLDNLIRTIRFRITSF